MPGDPSGRDVESGNAGWLSRARYLLDRLEARDGKPVGAAYVQDGAWLVRTSRMRSVAGHWLLPPARRLPGLRRARILGLTWRWLLPLEGRVRLKSVADAIQLSDDGNRLRAMYLGDPPRSVKMVAVTRRPDMRPDQEAALRARVAELGAIRVPRVFGSRVEDGVVVTEEEVVFGRRLMVRYDLAVIRDVLVPKLLATYRAAGLSYEPLRSFVPADLSGRLPPGRLGDAARGILDRSPDVAISFCHGDVAPSNIIVAGDEVVVIDWENAGRGIAPFDLLALALRYPANRALFSVVSTAVTEHLTERGARFADLLVLAMAIRMVREPSWGPSVPDWMMRAALGD